MLSNAIIKAAAMGKKPRGPYHARPSSAGPERCIRSMVYHALGYPEGRLIADRYYLAMLDSVWHETLTDEALGKTAYKLHSQQIGLDLPLPFPNKHYCKDCNKEVDGLHGHGDGIIQDLLKTELVEEHKALNGRGFERMLKRDWPLDYLTQTAIYLKSVRLINPEIRKAVVLVKCKDTSRYLDLVVNYDEASDTLTIENMEISGDPEIVVINEAIPNIVQTAIVKFVMVESYRARKVLPARPHPPGTDFPCGYCGWEPQCDEAAGDKYKKAREVVLLPPEMQEQADKLKALRQARLDAEKAEKAVKDNLTGQMLEAEIKKGSTQAGAWATLKNNKDGMTVEVK